MRKSTKKLPVEQQIEVLTAKVDDLAENVEVLREFLAQFITRLLGDSVEASNNVALAFDTWTDKIETIYKELSKKGKT